MNNRILLFLSTLLLTSVTVNADSAYVVMKFSGCDYYIADGDRGLYVLEWFGGYDPDEGDTINGDIGSYGMKDITINGSRSGRVWVEDFLESDSGAMDEIKDHCS
jgi:hypothetical protein